MFVEARQLRAVSRTAGFGDLSRFVVREVGGLRYERRVELLFGKDQVAVRGIRVSTPTSSTRRRSCT
jgi:hypothetical protein